VARDGKTTETDLSAADVQIVNGQTMVPLQVVASQIGGRVSWDPRTRTASVETAPNAPTMTDASAGGAAQAMGDAGAQYAPDGGAVYAPASGTAYSPDAAAAYSPDAAPGGSAAGTVSSPGATPPTAPTPGPVAEAPSNPAWAPWVVLAVAALAAVFFFLSRRGSSGRVIASGKDR
jgi:hypothetical protein